MTTASPAKRAAGQATIHASGSAATTGASTTGGESSETHPTIIRTAKTRTANAADLASQVGVPALTLGALRHPCLTR